MPITTKVKALCAGLMLLAQIYMVYAATLYVEVRSPGFACVVIAGLASTAGALFYVFVLSKRDEVGGQDAQLELEERRRIG